MNQEVIRKQPEEPRESVGDLIGPYQLVEMIGEGSMGRVYLAKHCKLGRQVALKVLRSEHVRSRSLVHRFFQEARAVNQINHEHIVQVFDFVEEETTVGEPRVYCVMELLKGASLAQLVARGPLAISRSIGITRQVCTALDAAHRVGVIHRDVKPDNIFVAEKANSTDFVKVLDFGVAKLTGALMAEAVSGTLEGTLVGTPTYMSPEQAAGLTVDFRADVYGVGTVLYEMLAGHPPFEMDLFGQLVVQIITKPPPALPAETPRGERIPTSLKKLVMSCLQKEPHRRPSSMAELSEALDAFSSGRRFRLRGSGRRWPHWAVAGIAAALVGTAAISSLRPASLRPAAPPKVENHSTTASRVTVAIRSFPPGAEVLRLDNGSPLGVTPVSVQLPRLDRPLAIRFKMEGYTPADRVLSLERDESLEVVLSALRSSPTEEKIEAIKPPKPPKKRMTRDGTIDPFSK